MLRFIYLRNFYWASIICKYNVIKKEKLDKALSFKDFKIIKKAAPHNKFHNIIIDYGLITIKRSFSIYKECRGILHQNNEGNIIFLKLNT